MNDNVKPTRSEQMRARFLARGSYAGASLQESRDFLARARPPGGPPVALIEDTLVGEPRVPVRIYRPRVADRSPVLVWTHGGGWCVGDTDTTDTLCRHLATRAACIVVSIDHRLAPEHPFPAPLDDVSTVIRWVLKNAASLGVDHDRIAVGGESSGANLTLGAILRLQGDESRLLARIRHQFLAVPVADLDDWPSMRADADPGLRVADLRWFEQQYVADPLLRDDPHVFPLRAPSFRGLPSATVVTAGLDPLCNGGSALVRRLAGDGVRVNHLHRPGAGHGMLADLSGNGPGWAALRASADLLRHALAAPG